ncbi:MAG: histone deacetylase family protein [Pseudomonadales bacterium]
MTTLITHPACLEHQMEQRHPERPERLTAVLSHLNDTGLVDDLTVLHATEATRDNLIGVHSNAYVDALEAMEPKQGLRSVNPDTSMGPKSLAAARYAVGAALDGVDHVLTDADTRVFCAVRPPGHHAEESTSMGFCFFNSVALAAHRALHIHQLERVAILDFDVHHCNGTVDAFQDDPRVLVCSSFQFPHYPYRLQDVDRPNIINTPLAAGTTGLEFRAAIERDWLPAIDEFAPALILVSAGFDAHRDDPLGDLMLDEKDFRWVTSLITDAANRHARGRIVSILEGGYDLNALANSVATHVDELCA